jgi:hypothetical protein
LDFTERVEVCVDPAEVPSGTRAFGSPKGIGGLVGDGLVVDVDDAGLDPVGEFEGRKGILGQRVSYSPSVTNRATCATGGLTSSWKGGPAMGLGRHS